MVSSVVKTLNRDGSEGSMSGQECADQLMKYINVDARVSVLGHIQRGGSQVPIEY